MLRDLINIDPAEVPVSEIPSALAALSALQIALTTRLMQIAPVPQSDTLLAVEQAAAKLSVTEDWLYRRGKKLGLAVKLGDGTLRFSTQAIDAYIRQQVNAPALTRRRKRRLDKLDVFKS